MGTAVSSSHVVSAAAFLLRGRSPSLGPAWVPPMGDHCPQISAARVLLSYSSSQTAPMWIPHWVTGSTSGF